jgi:ABC-type tungstate transport system permease subunit
MGLRRPPRYQTNRIAGSLANIIVLLKNMCLSQTRSILRLSRLCLVEDCLVLCVLLKEQMEALEHIFDVGWVAVGTGAVI